MLSSYFIPCFHRASLPNGFRAIDYARCVETPVAYKYVICVCKSKFQLFDRIQDGLYTKQ